MKKIKSIFVFVLTLVLVFCSTAMPASAAAKSAYKAKHPIILVHGLAGFGEYDDINDIIPYWGYTSGSIDRYLESLGNECYEASVGPISSAWDRACELYAQLTGTVTDYGAYHAAVHGHDRYGRDYTENGYGMLMDEAWSESNPVNLIGHSFGGVTCRTLIQLLEEGSEEEYSYAEENGTLDELSPLFVGGKKGWVYSLTTLAAPSNGSTVCEALPDVVHLVGDLMTAGSKALSMTSLKGLYDFQLEHYGITTKKSDTLDCVYARIIASGFMNHNDNAFADLALDKAIDMNASLDLQDDVYYFSYYGDRTYKPLIGNYKPTLRMWAPFQISGRAICNYKGTTAGYYYDGYGRNRSKIYVTKTKTSASSGWQRNDGMVPVESGQWPFHYENGKRVDDAHVSAKVGVKATKTATWYVMPVVDADHLTFCGGVLNETISGTHSLFNGIMSNIVNCGG